MNILSNGILLIWQYYQNLWRSEIVEKSPAVDIFYKVTPIQFSTAFPITDCSSWCSTDSQIQFSTGYLKIDWKLVENCPTIFLGQLVMD